MVSPCRSQDDAQLIADQALFIDAGRIALQDKPDILHSCIFRSKMNTYSGLK